MISHHQSRVVGKDFKWSLVIYTTVRQRNVNQWFDVEEMQWSQII